MLRHGTHLVTSESVAEGHPEADLLGADADIGSR